MPQKSYSPIKPLELSEAELRAQNEALNAMWRREYRSWQRAKAWRVLFEVMGVMALVGGLIWIAEWIQRTNIATHLR